MIDISVPSGPNRLVQTDPYNDHTILVWGERDLRHRSWVAQDTLCSIYGRKINSKKWNWFPKVDPMHWSFSTFSINNPSDLFAIFHHASKRSIMSSRGCNISTRVYSFKLIYCTCFFDVVPLDFNPFDRFLNCFIDCKNILKYLICWDIDYTQACTTPITNIKTPRVNKSDFYISLQRLLQARVEQSTCKTNWKHWSQLCCSSTTTSYLAEASAEQGEQLLG